MKNKYINPSISLLIFDEEDDILTASVNTVYAERKKTGDSTYSSVSVNIESIIGTNQE